MENEILISIIIPVYNAGKYLDKLLSDVTNQTYQNLEIVVINDGSNDESPQILEDFSKKDARIKVISVKNGGVSKARNIGIDNANGKLIRFVDADDRVPLNSTEYLAEAFNKNIELAIGNFIPIPRVPIFTGEEISEQVYNSTALIEKFAGCPRTYYFGVLWNKMYVTDIIKRNGIRFRPQYEWCEDLLFNMEYFNYVHNVCAINKPEGIYVYATKVTGSLTDKIERNEEQYNKIERERYGILYEYFKNYGLEEKFRLEWENVNLYYRITKLVKRSDNTDSLSLRYKRFLSVISKENITGIWKIKRVITEIL